ncbi:MULTISPECIES: hypothetical protein [unclassified Chryseobacterium]|uniref:hypothetical protein n=1 Tax=unclassified Chryseobacterium TaxID=2593645 RepID=UPI00226A053C|nr:MULTISPECIES: hypothetical protein [unclassified Chryseobacterium]
MKNQNLQNGKKLNKKELRVITGGLQMCLDRETGQCIAYGVRCGEFECRYPILP